MRDANYKLVQEEYEGDAWKIIVCSILLNRTRGEQVKYVALPPNVGAGVTM